MLHGSSIVDRGDLEKYTFSLLHCVWTKREHGTWVITVLVLREVMHFLRSIPAKNDFYISVPVTFDLVT